MSTVSNSQTPYSLIAQTVLQFAPVRISAAKNFGIMPSNTGRIKGNNQFVVRKNINHGGASTHLGGGTNEVASVRPKTKLEVYNIEPIKTNVAVTFDELDQFNAADLNNGYAIQPWIQAYISSAIEINLQLDRVCWVGDPQLGASGFLNSQNAVTTLSSKPFNAATPQEIYDDIKKIVSAINGATGFSCPVKVGFPTNEAEKLESWVTVNTTTLAQKLGEAIKSISNVGENGLVPVPPQNLELKNGNLAWCAWADESRYVGLALDQGQLNDGVSGVSALNNREISASKLAKATQLERTSVENALEHSANMIKSQLGMTNSGMDNAVIPNNLVATDFHGWFPTTTIEGGAWTGQAKIWTGGGIVSFRGMFQILDSQVPFAGSVLTYTKDGQPIEGANFGNNPKQNINSHIHSVQEALGKDMTDTERKKYESALKKLEKQLETLNGSFHESQEENNNKTQEIQDLNQKYNQILAEKEKLESELNGLLNTEEPETN